MKTTHYFHQYDIHNKECKTPFDLFSILHNQVSINITSIYKEYKTRETEEPRSKSCTRHYQVDINTNLTQTLPEQYAYTFSPQFSVATHFRHKAQLILEVFFTQACNAFCFNAVIQMFLLNKPFLSLFSVSLIINTIDIKEHIK